MPKGGGGGPGSPRRCTSRDDDLSDRDERYSLGQPSREFDPTNGIVGNRDLIRVAVARDALQAIPLFASYWGKIEDEEGMAVTVSVRKVAEGEGAAAGGLQIAQRR